MKEQSGRGQGELALMFMGINQIAQNLLDENPMTGYMSHVIFTRILGHEDIEQSGFWIDSSHCWLCDEFAKMTVTFNPIEDRAIMSRNIDRLEQLSYKLNTYVQKEII
jgi:hypothetical protein